MKFDRNSDGNHNKPFVTNTESIVTNFTIYTVQVHAMLCESAQRTRTTHMILLIVKFGICTYELSTDTHNTLNTLIDVCMYECLYARKVIENKEILSVYEVNERQRRRSSNHVQTCVHIKHIPNGITVLVY